MHFDWNFTTNDSYAFGFDDFAFFTATSASGTVALKLSDLQALPVGGGTTGWQTSSFTATAAGNYTLGFGAINTGDNQFSPTLTIDNLTGVSSSLLPTQITSTNENATPAGTSVAIFSARR